ncbi:GDYXXLXY domain-containing protein [Microbulbifer taiwanensis]|uniref:GDYXXLXY domain-containing protein n=1 Tax=Microbulbifer taiwanensis TaxID=986746 RepID=A0ABW1YU57_9GAMM|nr:GDYXXLXY domain-containing protein [Microbulbifer taiwanensis]
MNRKTTLGLLAAIALQFLILIGMYISAQMPLWTGEEIRLKTIPVDPRSLFRGNYARLDYNFSQLDASLFPADRKLREGELVYVSLKRDKRGFHRLAGASLEKPEEGVFLRGRISGTWLRDSRSSYRVRYGIEAFFAPKEKALGLESELRNGGVAEVMVSGGGRARLKNVSGNSIE